MNRQGNRMKRMDEGGDPLIKYDYKSLAGTAFPGLDMNDQAYQNNLDNHARYMSDPRNELAASGIGRDLPSVNPYNANQNYKQFTPPPTPSGYKPPVSPDFKLSQLLEGINVGVRGISEKTARNRQDQYTSNNLANPYSGILANNDGQSDGVKYGYAGYKLGGKFNKYPDGGPVPQDSFMRAWMNSPKYQEMLKASGDDGTIAKTRASNIDKATITVLPHKDIQMSKMVETRGRTDMNGNVQLSDKFSGDALYLTTNHEVSHATDLGTAIPQMDLDKLGKNPSEFRAKLNSTRALGALKGIYDPLNQNLNKDQFNQLIKEGGHDVQDLLKNYGKDKTFELLNSVSSTNNSDGLQFGKRGGRMPKCKFGGNIIDYLYAAEETKDFPKAEKGAVEENTAPDDSAQQEQMQYQQAMNIAQEQRLGRNPYQSQAQTPDENQLTVEQVLDGIGGIEGGRTGQKTALNSSARGRYQITDGTREGIRKKYFGNMSPEDFNQQYNSNPGFEQEVAKAHVGELMQRYGAAGAIESWYAGHPMDDNVVPGKSAGNKLSVGQYRDRVLSRIGNNLKRAK